MPPERQDSMIVPPGAAPPWDRIKAIIHLIPQPTIVHDDAGTVLLVNPVWSRMTGYAIEDIPTIADWERLAFGAPELSLGSAGERTVRTKDGEILVWDFSTIPLGPVSSERSASVMTAIDQTARRRAERARRENAEKFSALAEESPLGIVIARESFIIYCNNKAGALFGVPRRLSQGLTLAEWLLALPAEAGPVLRPLLLGEKAREGPFRVGPGKGSWIEAFGKSVGAASGDMIMVTFLDVTDRVLAEERERIQRRKLIQSEKLASLGELVAGVAHEINNPNHTISLNASILQEICEAMLPIVDRHAEFKEGDLIAGMEWPEARMETSRMISDIATASRDIDAIVRGLKDYARSEARPEPEEVSVNLVVKATLTLFSNLIKRSTSRLTVDLAEGLPPVRAHFQRLEQVTVNLLQNACQALISSDQAIRVSTDYDADTGLVRLLVADEGRGMTEEQMERIKDPFFTTKHDQGGVGLGVSISESIVSEYGGSLDYSSSPGKGTVATVSMPAILKGARGPERPGAAAGEERR